MDATLEAVTRESRGKNEARRLRVAGQIPAVVYGGGQEPQAVAVSPKELSRLLHSESGAQHPHRPQAGRRDHQGDRQGLPAAAGDPPAAARRLLPRRPDKKVQVKVAVRLHGEPRGVKVQGGVLDFVHREIEVESLPAEIPEHIDIDVSRDDDRRRRARARRGQGSEVDGGQPGRHAARARGHGARRRRRGGRAGGVAEPEVAKKGKPDAKDEVASDVT